MTTDWYCPNCGKTDQTAETKPHVRYHACAKLDGLSTPMVRKGVSAKVYTREREDYVAKEQVFYGPNGRPIMSIVTEYADGRNDAVVFAPLATAKGET
jgi:hypothetical protein